MAVRDDHTPCNTRFYPAAFLREASIPGVSFCLPAHPSEHLLPAYISAPPQAGKQKIDAHLSSIFAKKRFQRVMPLYFLEFVTNGAFSRSVPLSDFYKSLISESCAIRLFHRWGNIRSCDIKYVASRHGQRAFAEEKRRQI